MKYLNKYDDFDKINEVEAADMPTDIVNIFKKDPDAMQKEYEKVLGRKGHLSDYFRKNGKKFTFGVLKSIFHDAITYKKKRELVKGSYKMIHRAVPMALAFFFFPVWLVGNILGASRAFNKIISPILKNPENNYNDFLVKLLKGVIAVTEGEIKYLMPNDWFYSAFIMEDNLVKMVRKDVLRIFALELANTMENEPDDKEVPHHYVENELKKFLNDRFGITPPMELKSSNPEEKKINYKKY